MATNISPVIFSKREWYLVSHRTVNLPFQQSPFSGSHVLYMNFKAMDRDRKWAHLPNFTYNIYGVRWDEWTEKYHCLGWEQEQRRHYQCSAWVNTTREARLRLFECVQGLLYRNTGEMCTQSNLVKTNKETQMDLCFSIWTKIIWTWTYFASFDDLRWKKKI